MSWRDRDRDSDDDLDIRRRGPRYDRPPQRPGSSGWAVTSFVLALVSGLFLLGTILAAVAIGAGGPIPENDPRNMSIGCAAIGGLALAVFGLVLGFVGLGQNNGTVFAILGIVLNGLILLGVVGLMCIGIAAGG